MKMRIGHGYDVHRLVEGRELIIGGVNIPHKYGLLGHSDADVLLHAVMDALLGALGLGDIGRHFPDTDKEYEGISSLLLADRVCETMKSYGARIENIDCTVIAQKPKLLPYIPLMRENIAKAFDCDVTLVNVKATTEEGLGFSGAEEGISAHAVCLISFES
jgi:2-C-methyl-D-erythritol 2,4-cyclodiphosphate synthase